MSVLAIINRIQAMIYWNFNKVFNISVGKASDSQSKGLFVSQILTIDNMFLALLSIVGLCENVWFFACGSMLCRECDFYPNQRQI
jgi:hypothetical protein